MNKGTHSIFDSISLYLLQALIFFVPVFFLPSPSVPFSTAKAGLIILGSFLLFVLYLVGRIKDGAFSFPRMWGYGSVLILLATYALAAFFSGNIGVSIFGTALDQGSLVFIAASVILFLLVPLILDTEEKVFYSYIGLFVSFFVVALYESLHLIFPGFSFGVFTSSTANMIGSWNDLAVFFGLSTVLSLITLERISLSKVARILVYVCLIASLFFLIVINFSEAWWVTAFFALAFLIYGVSTNRKSTDRKFPVRLSAVLLLSVIFIFFGTSIGGVITNITQVSQTEVRPAFGTTLTVINTNLQSHALFGVGPDRFTTAWFAHKPAGINSTVFWNIDFNYGIGFLPSLFVTVGLLGALGALAFVLLFLIKGVRSLFAPTKSSIHSYLLVSSFIACVYLWTFVAIYVPSMTLIALAFIFSGIFIAILVTQGIVPVYNFKFIDSPVKNFISILVIVLVLVGTIALGYSVTEHARSEIAFQRANTIFSTSGDLNSGESAVAKAYTLSANPLYSRAIADIYLQRIANLLQSTTTTQSDATKQFQSLLSVAIQAAQQSVALDPTDYQNYLELGKVYGSVVSLKITGAYDAAKTAFAQAIALNPDNPEIYYDLAQLDRANDDDTSAEADLNKALSEKGDYADAIYLLSQIYINANELPKATAAVKALSVISPSNPGVFFELGLLEYNESNYADAATAFEQAVTLSPGYANAQYFLGLSDYYLKDNTHAIAQFESLAKTNPDNAEVASILANLKAGKPPFSTAAAAKSKSSASLPVKQ